MRDYKTRLTALALAAALALTACGGMRREDTSYPKPEFSGSPHGRKEPCMTTSQSIEALQTAVIEAVNASRLHPAVVRLVLLNVMSMVEASEREINKKEEASFPNHNEVSA